MAATYDSTLPTSRDKVRFLIGDTAATFEFQDEELDWVLTEQTNVYFAAARALSILLGRWSRAGKGVAEKQVSKLRVRYGVGGGRIAIEQRIQELRELGSPTPRFFEAFP